MSPRRLTAPPSNTDKEISINNSRFHLPSNHHPRRELPKPNAALGSPQQRSVKLVLSEFDNFDFINDKENATTKMVHSNSSSLVSRQNEIRMPKILLKPRHTNTADRILSFAAIDEESPAAPSSYQAAERCEAAIEPLFNPQNGASVKKSLMRLDIPDLPDFVDHQQQKKLIRPKLKPKISGFRLADTMAAGDLAFGFDSFRGTTAGREPTGRHDWLTETPQPRRSSIKSITANPHRFNNLFDHHGDSKTASTSDGSFIFDSWLNATGTPSRPHEFKSSIHSIDAKKPRLSETPTAHPPNQRASAKKARIESPIDTKIYNTIFGLVGGEQQLTRPVTVVPEAQVASERVTAPQSDNFATCVSTPEATPLEAMLEPPPIVRSASQTYVDEPTLLRRITTSSSIDTSTNALNETDSTLLLPTLF